MGLLSPHEISNGNGNGHLQLSPSQCGDEQLSRFVRIRGTITLEVLTMVRNHQSRIDQPGPPAPKQIGIRQVWVLNEHIADKATSPEYPNEPRQNSIALGEGVDVART